MPKLHPYLVVLLLFFTCNSAFSQGNYSINGTVKEATGETLPGATVFLANTKYYAATGPDGKFTLNNVEAGTYQLVIKMMGFAPYINKITVGANTPPISVVLKDDSKLLKTVTISATDPNREKYLKIFTQYFIGESTNSNQCKILNPKVLNFHFDKGTGILQASTNNTLAIENDGLGYQLTYLLTGFTFDPKNLIFSYNGYFYFEELKGTESQQAKWARNRKSAYLGSMRHFFKAAFNGSAQAEGFSFYKVSGKAMQPVVVPVSPDSLFSPAEKNLKSLNARYIPQKAGDSTALYVFYHGASSPYEFISSGMYINPPFKTPSQGQLSKLEPVSNKILIDKNGVLTPEQSFIISGYWAWEKIAELMPLDYTINNSELPALNEPIETATLDKKMEETIDRFARHTIYHPTEKIYVQLNKPAYKLLDTIWFKTYTVAANYKPTGISEVAYVLLVDDRDSVIQQVNLKLHTGVASGAIELPDSITPGIYHIKAYTNWMRNDDEDYFFDRQVNIGNVVPVIAIPDTSKGIQPDIQFFPEGGTLVNGLRSIVAFKAVDPNGLPATIKGNIVASDGRVITTIQSGHDGMGVFEIVPQEGKTYQAVVRSNNSQSQTVALPAPEAEGFVLTINNNDQKVLSVKVAANSLLLKNKTYNGFYLVAQTRGKIVYSTAAALSGPVFNYNINKEKLPSGILRFTLFSDAGEPLDERVVFISPADALVMNQSGGKNTYTPNEKTSLAVKVSDATGKPASGSFSASVINESLIPTNEIKEPTIFSQLLLSSELSGAINDPAYYFKKDDKAVSANLDMLMLTQGYRKLEWKKLLDTAKQAKFAAEGGLTISGIVKDMSGKPVINGHVSLLVLGQRITADTVTDNTGRFAFTGIDISDTSSVILKATMGNNNNSYVNIYLDHYSPQISPVIVPVTGAQAIALQKNQRQGQALPGNKGQLKEVVIKDKKITTIHGQAPWLPVLIRSANLNGPGQANQVILGEKLGDCITLSDCLAARLTAVHVYPNGEIIYIGRGKKSFYYIPKRPFGKGIPKDPDAPPDNAGQSMAVFVDGGEINSSMINEIHVDDIYSIEVLTSVAYTRMYGFDGSGGVILITTKHPGDNIDYTKVKRPPGIINYVFNGYYKARSFYTPKYAVSGTPDDQRSAIYWDPNLQPDKEGKINLEFNNAGKGSYRAVIEGIDDDGNIGRFVYRYKVE